jgi:hypothetical protein
MKNKNKINGYNERHLAQLIRRKMISKVKPSGKIYSRKNKQDSKESSFILGLALQYDLHIL